MAPFAKEVNPRLAKRPLKTNGRLAIRGLTSVVKEATGEYYDCLATSQAITVYPKKYAHGFVVLCFVVVMQSFIMNSLEVFIRIHQGCFAGIGAIARLPQCQWSKPDGYGKISECITTTKHSKAKTVCIFLGIYCMKDIRKSITGTHQEQIDRNKNVCIFKTPDGIIEFGQYQCLTAPSPYLSKC